MALAAAAAAAADNCGFGGETGSSRHIVGGLKEGGELESCDRTNT